MSVNPLVPFTELELWDQALALHLACGRNKAVTKDKHRVVLCHLASVVDAELLRRGRPPPSAPFKA